ncbi:protoporphyrinogen oxidase [Ilumatobacter sp.]|uniref:protoporphyrinogen oxidase n=1 Tax=Ilumatobacter sp. TaxID=1967498 RepID=UPI003AF7B013
MGGRRFLVIGGGVTGLAAGVSLLDEPDAQVELWERVDRIGGKIAGSRFAGLDDIDEGADAYLTRVPAAVAFARRLGLNDLTAPTDATAAVWHDGLHPIPGGIVLGMPAAIGPFVTTSLLSWRGKLRAAAEPLLPRRPADDHLGALVRQRFGDEVHERLVDALVGSIYATDTDHSSLAAVPQLAQLAESNRSLLMAGRRARRTAPSTNGPIFAAPRSGMATLTQAAADDIRARGGTIRTGIAATTIESDDGGWRVDGERFDAVVLAAPARAAAELLTGVAPGAADELRAIEYADVIMVRLAVDGTAWPERLRGRSGYLVPKPDQRHVTAASFGSQKWAHWQPDDGSQILRTSLGRDGLPVRHLDDDEAVRHTIDEMNLHLGLDLQPTNISITRWFDAFPQYRPHHHERIARVESGLPSTIAVAGASYRGIGIPACVADGTRAAMGVKAAATGADGILT